MVDAFLDRWGFIEIPLDQGFRQWRHAAVELRPMDPSLWFLAVDGDHTAGIALCAPGRTRTLIWGGSTHWAYGDPGGNVGSA